MNYSKHCDLCENEQTSLKNGLTCSLTNRKPNFKNTCSKINLNEKFQEKLEYLNLELENRKKEKKSVHTKFYLFIIIGFLLITGGVYLFKSTKLSVYGLQVTYMFFGGGISILGIAYNILNKHRRKLYNAEYDKYEIDEFLKLYGIEYDTNIDFKEKIHGIQEVNVEFEFKNWTKKRTTTKN
ncbi:hypothetical protein [Tenacibaculum sp. nBUS_03]|uniref:hypothetical protein n=1 Tax=Tenacibaculum sp. nBUS_03 TaxID=3395320 RepID=UPI003EB716A4